MSSFYLREASLESDADTQAELKIVGGPRALRKESLTNNIISDLVKECGAISFSRLKEKYS
ncbi:MAG TPA: hypothetical protein VGQ41_20895 [Pyrinomonadaceae bacterium]|jgi:hypothetical protein|nr:hypothetical protein [Pyrinomonadaceae bacterium]